jgi:hypothetical protein
LLAAALGEGGIGETGHALRGIPKLAPAVCGAYKTNVRSQNERPGAPSQGCDAGGKRLRT